MSEASEIATFAESLRKAFGTFKDSERLIRQQYARDVASGTVPEGFEEDDLLERPTRRFLIDGILRGLDWNPDDPAQVVEEARSWGEEGDRLYFDYLGVAPYTRAPVILIEAKRYDVKAARRPRGQEPGARAMAELISAALESVKSGDKSRAIIAEWAEWLKDLQSYVASLGALGQSTLRRAMITAGRWLIIFEEPIPGFIRPGAPSPDHIHCFTNLLEILDRHVAVFRLLHRQRLVDTLPLSMPVAEALDIIAPATITKAYRGVLVVTTASGGSRMPYPTRSVYPVLIVTAANCVFAIVDYARQAVEEPLVEGRFAEFLDGLAARGTAYEARLMQQLGRAGLRPLPIQDFPGFRDALGQHDAPEGFNPVTGSTAAYREDTAESRRSLVVRTGQPGALPEYLVVTGQDWFYKSENPIGPDCDFHAWPMAKKAGVAASTPHVGSSATSYTESGQMRHCAHEQLRGMRDRRCHIAVVESHLCCRACVFHSECWANDASRLPCPQEQAESAT